MKRGKMKIIFVCKYNRFRSRIAEAYFKQINKNKNIQAESAGLLPGHYPLDKEEVEVARKNGLKLSGRPRGLSTDLLREIDLVVIAADNVPRSIFNYDRYKGKIKVWRIKDITSTDGKVLIEKRIKKIKKKVEKLVRKLEDVK
jgi:protein-tyrosine-phosphatase